MRALNMCAPSFRLSILCSHPQLKIEDALDKSPTGWFAGGPNPTMADYMMSFGLEAAAARMPNMLGPKTKAWVERIHERCAIVLLSSSTNFTETRLS